MDLDRKQEVEDTFYGKRGSGRTTRMLEAVAKAVLEGSSSVCVVVQGQHHVPLMKRQLTFMLHNRVPLWPDLSGARAESVRKATILSALSRVYFVTSEEFDWQHHRPYRAPGGALFVDHWAVQKYMASFEPLLRLWDSPVAGPERYPRPFTDEELCTEVKSRG